MEQKTTPMGTPCSPCWGEVWIQNVVETEQRLGRRVCGARTPAGTPCTLEANHENGRCKFHGGYNLTGAQRGNRNAVVHGLYSRGVQRCGTHCPMWESCGCAGPEVAELPAKERPECPYEKAQYQSALTDAMTRAPKVVGAEPDPHYAHLAHQSALLSVMMTRAAAALGQVPLVETAREKGNENGGVRSRPSGYLEAFLRLSSEHRRYLKLLEETQSRNMDDAEMVEHGRRAEHDTEVAPEDVEALAETRGLANTLGEKLLGELKARVSWERVDYVRARIDRLKRLAPGVLEPELGGIEAVLAERMGS